MPYYNHGGGDVCEIPSHTHIHQWAKVISIIVISFNKASKSRIIPSHGALLCDHNLCVRFVCMLDREFVCVCGYVCVRSCFLKCVIRIKIASRMMSRELGLKCMCHNFFVCLLNSTNTCIRVAVFQNISEGYFTIAMWFHFSLSAVVTIEVYLYICTRIFLLSLFLSSPLFIKYVD